MMREAANTGEKPVAMKGDTTLLDGTLSAVATVSRGFERGPKATRVPGDPKDSLEEQGRRGRRDRDSDGLTEVYSTGFGDSEEEQKEAMKEYYRMALARRAQGSPLDSQQVHPRAAGGGAAGAHGTLQGGCRNSTTVICSCCYSKQ